MYDKNYDVFLPQPLVWKAVKGYEGYYEVSNYGEVKSLKRTILVNRADGLRERTINERIMKKKYDKYGFAMVGLSLDGEVLNRYVHDFVFKTFYPDKLFLHHKDFNVENTFLWNLESIDQHKCTYDETSSKIKESELTQEFLRECFDYHEDGYLVWKLRPPEHFKTLSQYRCFRTDCYGKRAGYFNKRTDSKREGFGYWRTGITFGDTVSNFKLHRLIFLWHKGYLPRLVDHKDTDCNNNRIENLREGDIRSNGWNSNTPVNNTTGYKGVTYTSVECRSSVPYRASVSVNKETFFLGSYSCRHKAAYAYNLAALALCGEYAKLNDTPYNGEGFVFKGKFFKEIYPKVLTGTYIWKEDK